MSSLRFHTSRSCKWNEPRQQQHASQRLHVHGRVLPLTTGEKRLAWSEIRTALWVGPLVLGFLALAWLATR